MYLHSIRVRYEADSLCVIGLINLIDIKFNCIFGRRCRFLEFLLHKGILSINKSLCFNIFLPCKKSDIAARVRVRSGETKLGELIKVPEDASLVSFLQETSARLRRLRHC